MSLLIPVADSTTPLFSPTLVSPEVLAALPEGYKCRPLQRNDYQNGFLDVLRVLTTVGDVTEEVNTPIPYPLLISPHNPQPLIISALQD